MRKVIGVITARMASTRLPGKVLQMMAGKSVFAHHVERMKNIKGLEGVFLATSNDPLNKQLIEEAERLDCGWFAGAEQDIVDRHIKLCEREGADAVIRVTCDSPIFDIGSASRFVGEFKKNYRDFISVFNMTMIQGTLSELISYNALLEVHKHYRGTAVSMYIKENMGKFSVSGIEIDTDLCRPEYRLTIDEAIDIEMIRHVYNGLYKGHPLALHDVYTWLDDNPEIAKLNMHIGIKGCEQQSANLAETPLYSIVRSGSKYVILDDMKKMVNPDKFLERFLDLFPEMKK
ncbi:MAG: cytidylyltransferase domain-containing protein [Candidatus Scalindua sp.]